MAVKRAASISMCGRYRYRLTRYWGPGYMMPFVMLNPSTADAEVDDPTIRRVMGFARTFGAGGIVVVNLFALRATDPRELRTATDPRGPDNDTALASVAIEAEANQMPIVCAWGARGSYKNADSAALALFDKTSSARVVCLGTTKHGAPCHPLYLSAASQMQDFRP